MGYHGRASSISVSGSPVRRPWGQVAEPGASQPALLPCRVLDFELEMVRCRARVLGLLRFSLLKL